VYVSDTNPVSIASRIRHGRASASSSAMASPVVDASSRAPPIASSDTTAIDLSPAAIEIWMSFDIEAATQAHMAALSADTLARAAAYTAGTNWLVLWGLLVGALTTWMVMRWGIVGSIQDRLVGRGPTLRTLLVSAAALLFTNAIAYPFSVYTEYVRERSYGRTSQPLGDFLAQHVIGTVLSIVLGALFFVGIYALIRRAGRRWWLWSGGLTAVFAVLAILAAPILIEPIFNEYEPLPSGDVRTALETMADEAGIPHDRIFVYDGSRQSNNFTANVSGVFGSARIAISDVALKGASLDEVKAVTGHEVGHYVLGHIWRMILLFSVLSILFFYLADRLFAPVARIFRAEGTIGEPGNLPVLLFLIVLLMTLAMPLNNWLSRLDEWEADNYSLAHVNLPDALATSLVKTAEYRDPRPHPLQEAVFYTHPAVERRVRNAMTYKAATAGSGPSERP
jgi:STE24 endopeptidase